MYFGYSSYNSFMEVSNSEVFFSQEEDPNSMELNLLVTPALHDRPQREKDSVSSSTDSNDKESTIIQENQEDNECRFLVSSTLESSKEFNPIVQEAQESSQEFKNVHIEEAQESSQEFKNVHIEEAQESSQEFRNVHIEEAQESSQEFKNTNIEEGQEEVDDGFKTPTSLENKIPAVLKCPPAPKKPKSVPLSKRKCPARRRVLLDLSNEIESLFPPDVLKDLIGGKIKKVRKEFDRIC